MDYSELIKRTLQNDKASQFALYKVLLPKVMGVCRRYLREIQEAEDCVQESFIKIFKNLATYSGDSPFEAWIRKITVNEALISIRKNKKFSFNEDIDLYNDIKPSESMGVLAQINHQELLQLLYKLPENKRVVFNMYTIEGYSHKEISEILGITEGTSRSSLSRSKDILAELLTKMDQL